MDAIKKFFSKTTEASATSDGPCGLVYSDDIWREIFLRSSYSDLLNIRLACSRFCNILTNSFWKMRCERDMISLPPRHVLRLAHQKDFDFDYWYIYHYATLYHVNPYGNNIIENLPLDPEKAHEFASDKPWIVYESHGCTYESPPGGYNAGGESPYECLATSYHWGSRNIQLKLTSMGVEAWVLDKLRPRIIVSEVHAPRFDCAAEYKFSAQMLLPDEEINWDSAIPGVRGSEIRTNYVQFGNQPWVHKEIVLERYPVEMRQVKVLSRGKDEQFWAGNYGMKFAGTSIRIEFPEDVHWFEPDEIKDVPREDSNDSWRPHLRSLRVPLPLLRRGRGRRIPPRPANNDN